MAVCILQLGRGQLAGEDQLAVGNGQLADEEQSADGGRDLDGIDGIADWNVLTAEMKRYEYSYSPTGHISYSAPSGYHDDCVIALALANQGRWQSGNAGRMLQVAGGGRLRAAVGRRRERVLVG